MLSHDDLYASLLISGVCVEGRGVQLSLLRVLLCCCIGRLVDPRVPLSWTQESVQGRLASVWCPITAHLN